MMDVIKKNMVFVLGILLVVGGLVVYLNFFASNTGEALVAATSDSDSPVTKELLVTLSSLNTIKLDTTIFTNPVFESLVNFGVELPDENVGRTNPFLPADAK